MLCLLVSTSEMELMAIEMWMERRQGAEEGRGREEEAREKRGPSSGGDVIAVIVRTRQPEAEKRRSGEAEKNKGDKYRAGKAVASY